MQLSSAPGIGPAYTRRWRPFHADSLHGRAAAHRRLKDERLWTHTSGCGLPNISSRTAPQQPARHHRRAPLRLANHRQDADHSCVEADSTPSTAIGTLALLELLLAQPTADQGLTPDLGLHPGCMPSTANSAPTDDAPQSDLSEHSLAPADIWTEAWLPLEPTPAQQALLPADVRLKPLPSLLFWRQQQQQQQNRSLAGRQHRQHIQHASSQKPKPKGALSPQSRGLAAATVMKNAQMHLQGVEPAARVQLIALCMAALENLTSLMFDQAVRLTCKEWRQLCPAVLAVCSVQAATSWLGYCPGELLRQARQVVRHLDRGCGSSNSASSLTMAVGHLRHALPDEASSPEQQQASTSAAVESSLTASSQRSADTASVPDAEEAQTSSSSAWQFAVENVVLHATVLRHMCQHSSDALSRSGQGVGAPALSASTQGAQSGAVQADAVQQSRSPPLRSIAHLRLAGKHTSAGAHQSQTSVGQRREQAALQLLLQSAPSVLQDMAAQAAEAVAVCYLAEARSGLTGGSEGDEWWPLHLHPQLRSTRSLERFRNQVSLNRLVHQNFHSVANIYEDRHQLCGFGPNAELLQRSLKARRVKELEALKGWKYTVSFLLEAGDIALPIFRSCMARVSAAISWLLVKLIGRALGLIYRGVKQSLVPQGPKERKGQEVETDMEAPRQWMPRFS